MAISSSFHDPNFYSLSISVIVKASSGPRYVVGFITDSILMSKQGSDVSSNHLSELAPVNKEKSRKIKGFRKSSEVAFVILAPKVFKILEKPVHEFHGHGGEILSLSWSRKGWHEKKPTAGLDSNLHEEADLVAEHGKPVNDHNIPDLNFPDSVVPGTPELHRKLDAPAKRFSPPSSGDC
ncbi:unnamed protein product [Lactuca saligna]|uniref:Uncharacterized protein n=1 Tax=Lactuca saligna TaxID=75948 RepID=A0AA35YD52_LACSI|nr:unnamed protein product [Lactuca saligna]